MELRIRFRSVPLAYGWNRSEQNGKLVTDNRTGYNPSDYDMKFFHFIITKLIKAKIL